jgi:antitoxin (DNA-binding transcriptional repressor) of toxin-antitoxin stability system
LFLEYYVIFDTIIFYVFNNFIMKTITSTELARNLRQILDQLVIEGGEIVVERNHHQVARLIAGPSHQSALEAMADLYRTLSEDAAHGWQRDSQQGLRGESINSGVRDPWAS